MRGQPKDSIFLLPSGTAQSALDMYIGNRPAGLEQEFALWLTPNVAGWLARAEKRKEAYKKMKMGINQVTQVTQRVAAALELREPYKYTSHSMRRSSATELAANGATTAQLTAFFGWSNPKTNATHAAFLIPNGEAADAFLEYISLRDNGPYQQTDRLWLSVNRAASATHPFKAVPMGENLLGQVTKKIAGALGLDGPERYTAHAIRRSAATQIALKGGSPHQLQSSFGWKSLATASEYVQTSNSLRVQVSNMLAPPTSSAAVPPAGPQPAPPAPLEGADKENIPPVVIPPPAHTQPAPVTQPFMHAPPAYASWWPGPFPPPPACHGFEVPFPWTEDEWMWMLWGARRVDALGGKGCSAHSTVLKTRS